MAIEVELEEAFDYAEKINVYNDGKVCVYAAGEEEFEEILIGWKSMIEGAHQMPAFGVSLNEHTKLAMNSGLWTEFVFGGCYENGGMPFEKLLIKVEQQSQGFNLIRYNSESGYDGRCFYYDLVGKNMSDFYDLLLNF